MDATSGVAWDDAYEPIEVPLPPALVRPNPILAIRGWPTNATRGCERTSKVRADVLPVHPSLLTYLVANGATTAASSAIGASKARRREAASAHFKTSNKDLRGRPVAQ